MWDFTRAACEEFLDKVGDGEFKDTAKVIKGLDIGDEDEIFLIHDGTLFKSGKDGFAITDYGFYCREMEESESHFLDWGDFAECETVDVSNSLIMADDTSVAYYTGNPDVFTELRALFRKLHKHAGLFDWS